MVLIKNYNEFINRVNQLGFMALSNVLTGLPSVVNETTMPLAVFLEDIKGLWLLICFHTFILFTILKRLWSTYGNKGGLVRR
ncbi:MAG: hypothetical protein K0R50_2464 [Eubacterium sp.]|nr:hypothetical protein [Eubacterium sp.]